MAQHAGIHVTPNGAVHDNAIAADKPERVVCRKWGLREWRRPQRLYSIAYKHSACIQSHDDCRGYRHAWRTACDRISPQLRIELMDSATNNILAVLDSFIVTNSTDTLNRTGTLVYFPSTSVVNKSVYVRARIQADSAVAQWNLTSELDFDMPDTLDLPVLNPFIDNFGV